MFDGWPDAFRPPLSPWAMAALLAAAFAMALLLYVRHQRAVGGWQRGVLAVLRGVALLAMGWVLMGPTVLHHAPPESARVELWVLADTSASMARRDAAIPGRAEPSSRWEALRATWLSDETLEALSAVADVRLLGFDDRARPLPRDELADIAPTGSQTRLIESVTQVAQAHEPGVPAPVLLVLSDGHDTRAGGPGDSAAMLKSFARRGGRIFAVPVGSTRSVPDVAVQAWPDADVLFDGQSATIHATAVQRGYGDRRVRVDLFHEGRLVQTREVAFAGEPTGRASFHITPQADPGQPVTVHAYRVRARLVDRGEAGDAGRSPPESYLDNNTRPVFVQVSRERVRVLLLEGEPYWDTRFLAQVLRDDPHVDLTAIFHLGGDRELRIVSDAAGGTDAPPPAELTQAALNDFDVVILGKAVGRLLPDAAMLVGYVRQRGGALVLARGRPFDDEASRRVLSPILPVVWGRGTVERLSLELTPQGQQSPLLAFEGAGPTDAILTRLPGMIAATRIERERAASVVLLRQSPADAQAPGMAAIAYQRAGAGQVMAVLTDGLWRWALLPGDLDRYGSVYGQFWSRAIRWLASGDEFLPGREVSMTLDRLTVEPRQPVGVTITTRWVDPSYRPVIRVIGPEGQRHTLQPEPTGVRPARYRATFRPRQPGVYRLTLNRPAPSADAAPLAPIEARLAVFERSTERLDPSARPQVLGGLADATGGRCLGLDESAELVAYLRSLRQARAADVKPLYDFARPWVMAAIVGCFGLEWFLRRRIGLL